MHALFGLLAGLLFGLGLAVSGMTDTAKVLGFLDLFGDWDVRLAAVMAGGLSVTIPAYMLTQRRRPWFERNWSFPQTLRVDEPLVMGAILFGLGWGLYGYCPGPAIASLAYGHLESLVFVLAMAFGMVLADRVSQTITARGRNARPS